MDFFKHIVKSDFAKDVLTLMSGTVLAQGIAVLLYPAFSRIYSPSEFGDITLYMSIVGAFAIVATARYERAIVIAPDESEALALIKISHRVSIGVAFLNLLLVLVFMLIYGHHFSMSPTFKIWLFLMPVFTFMFGSSQAYTHWFIRNKSFKVIAISKIINSLGINVGMLLLGFLSLGLLGLYLANFIGLLLIFLYLIYIFIKKQYKYSVQKSELKVVAKKYIDFPKTNSMQALVEMFQMNGIIYLLGIFFTSSCVGLFSFSMKVLMAPMWLIGSSLSQVFYQKASEEYLKTQNLRPLFKKTLFNSSLIAIPVFIIIFVAGPSIFSFVFGKEWHEAGVYARILTPWIFLDFVRAPLSQIPIITGRIKSMFGITLIGNIILLVTMILGGILKDEKIAFISLSAAMSIYVILLILWIYKVSVAKNEN